MRQEIHCHNCQQYVQFDVDEGIDGNHVLNCPNCDHEHCRVVKNGEITGERWAQRNGPTILIPQHTITYTTTSSFSDYLIINDSTTSGSMNVTITDTGQNFIRQSWLNTRSTT